LSPHRIGVFGGTFDPIHFGHLQLAEQAIKEVKLSKLLFIPAAKPPHKNGIITPIEHRIAMLELVCEGSEHFSCSSIEAELPKPSYTVDTLVELMERDPEDAELYFIIGGDAFLDLMTWKSYTKILSMVQIVVSPRIGYSNQSICAFLDRIGYMPINRKWQSDNGRKDIIFLSESPQDVCSSKLREVMAKGRDTTTLLPEVIAGYIKENSLYNL
jgi:nicotinate-nucleotide adenylyltransferase